ncbi:hypothetical protein K438DRAFT_1782060 [Mycena galopus ATCC 62051]|nr:hypothetical protein K438DRAFT_1782060 [Mycena galopus ATCC 62051]
MGPRYGVNATSKLGRLLIGTRGETAGMVTRTSRKRGREVKEEDAAEEDGVVKEGGLCLTPPDSRQKCTKIFISHGITEPILAVADGCRRIKLPKQACLRKVQAVTPKKLKKVLRIERNTTMRSGHWCMDGVWVRVGQQEWQNSAPVCSESLARPCDDAL